MENPLFKLIQSTFRLPLKDARTLAWLFLLIFLLLSYPIYLRIFSNDTSSAIGSISNNPSENKEKYPQQASALESTKAKNASLTQAFPFNPNTLSKDSLELLNLPQNTIAWLIRMRGLNKKLQTKADFYALYGINDSIYKSLQAFLLLPDTLSRSTTQTSAFRNNDKIPSTNSSNTKAFEKPKLYTFNLNACDSSALEQLPFIGQGMAQRIIYHREKLGGFHSLEQLYEIYLLDSLPVKWIKAWATETDFSALKKIDINTCAIGTLREHPYIGWKKAEVLIKYRLNHGAFCTLDDVNKTRLFSPTELSNLAPYLHLQANISSK